MPYRRRRDVFDEQEAIGERHRQIGAEDHMFREALTGRHLKSQTGRGYSQHVDYQSE